MTTADLFIDSRNALGEGPIWHPGISRFFWFDILKRQLLSATADGTLVGISNFDEIVAAAGVIDNRTLAVFSERRLMTFDIETQEKTTVIEIEADIEDTRANDSRVNPAGGFWLGTMSKTDGSKRVGSLYQYRTGELVKLLGDVGVPNSICFSPDRKTGYFTGTVPDMILKVAIDPETGLPIGEWKAFASIRDRGGPDGSVVDSEGFLWNARWNGSCVVRYAPDGSVDRVVEVPASRVTCPCFGGDDLKTLFITTSRDGLSNEELAKQPHAGSVFAIHVDIPGLPETTVKL